MITQSNITRRTKCAGCGAEIPPSRGGRARKWCSDRCRKQTMYGGTCIDCGGPTNGSDGKAPERCNHCAPTANAKWNRENVIQAAQAFRARYGRVPRQLDWNPPGARGKGHAWRAERFYADGCWPHCNTVNYLFGTWNAMIEAAGLEVFDHARDHDWGPTRPSKELAAP